MIPQYGTYFVPESVLNYPSMATKSEKAVLYWLARNHFRGDGIIVDAGIYLGGSTNALAHGVRDNPKSASFSGKVIQSYDIAVWTKGMARKLPDDSGPWEAFAGKNLRPGKSFEAALRGVLEPHADLVDLRIGDIIETAFAASPVEIAFYDCLKTNQRDIAVFKALPRTTFLDIRLSCSRIISTSAEPTTRCGRSIFLSILSSLDSFQRRLSFVMSDLSRICCCNRTQ